jgi:hypothetical protein
MAYIWGQFEVGGLPRNGATVKLWSEGAFASRPQKNTAIPSGSPLATGTTGPSHGCDGAYSFDGLASGSYYASIEWNGLTVYQQHRIDDATGRGETLATNYANLQLAINATPSGSTLYIPPGTYTISGSDYVWNHFDGTSVTGLVVDKPINIIGAGRRTRIQSGAANVSILTIYDVTGSVDANKPAYMTISDLYLAANGFAGVSGVVYDRSKRQRIRDCRIDGGHTNILIKGAWLLDIKDNYLLGGSNTQYGIRAMPFLGANPTTVYIHGGEIVSGVVGVQFELCSMAGMTNSTVELCTSGGVVVSGSNRVTLDACYFENLDPAYDVIVNGFSDRCRIDNVERILLRDCNGIEVNQYRDRGGNVFDVVNNSQGVYEIQLNNTWWHETSGNTDGSRTILQQAERGTLRIQNVGEPWLNVPIFQDHFGGQLLGNPSMADNAAGWSFANMAITGASGIPFGYKNVAVTTGIVAGSSGHAEQTIDATFTDGLKGRTVTLCAWVKIPATDWTAVIQITDGDTNKQKLIPAAFKDGNWHLIFVTMRVGESATGVQCRVRYIAGASVGDAYIGPMTCVLGTIPMLPPHDTFLGPRIVQEPAYRIKGVRSLTTSSTIDPTAGRVQRIKGDGAPVTLSGVATFGGAGQRRTGLRVTLIGDDDTDTVSFVSGATTLLAMQASPRVLGKNDSIEFMYDSVEGRWIEMSYNA